MVSLNMMMRRFPIVVIAILHLLIVAAPGISAEITSDNASNVVIRAAVAPRENIVVGQRVILQVDVLASEGWAQVKGVRDFSVEGAQVIRYESQGTRLNETIQGQTYTGQRYQLSLFPWREGTLTIPSIPVEVEISRWGSKTTKASKRLQTPKITFQAKIPPGAEGVSGLISTSGLTAIQRWDPESQTFEVGEAIKRTIELGGEDISGMAFSPLDFKSTQMISVYPAEPSVNDSFNRGMLTGKRVETVTYVFAGVGPIELPEIVIQWWDVNQKKMQQTILPALKLEITPSPIVERGKIGSQPAEEHIRLTTRRLTNLVIALMIFLIPAAVYRKRIRSLWKQWRQTRREKENFYFRQFAKAARSNDLKLAYNLLMRWLDHIHKGPGAARLDKFLQRFGGEKSQTEADLLAKALSIESTDWTGASLLHEMSAARRRWKKVRHTGVKKMYLPALNP